MKQLLIVKKATENIKSDFKDYVLPKLDSTLDKLTIEIDSLKNTDAYIQAKNEQTNQGIIYSVAGLGLSFAIIITMADKFLHHRREADDLKGFTKIATPEQN